MTSHPVRVSLRGDPDEPRRQRRAGVLVALALLAWTAGWAWWSWGTSGLSWHYFADGGRALLHGDGLAVYARHPELQVGPLALLVSGLLEPWGSGRAVAQAAMALTGPVLVVVLGLAAPVAHRWGRVLAAGLLVTPGWVVLAVRWGHLDDVLAMAGAVLAVYAVRRDRALPAGLALAAAVAAKPWAIGFVPLLLGLTHARVRAALVAAAGAVLAWLPFVATPGTLEALRPPVPLIPGSGLHTLGVRGRDVPDWGRTTQLLAAPLAGLLAALRGRWAGVLLVAVAVRLALDPQDNPYYIGSAVVAAAAFDLAGTHWRVPWTTLATALALWQPFVADYQHRLDTTTGISHWWFTHPTAVGWVHLAWAGAMVVVVLTAPGLRSRR